MYIQSSTIRSHNSVLSVSKLLDYIIVHTLSLCFFCQYLHFSEALDPAILDYCCDKGVSWYSQSRGRCRSYLATVPNINSEQQFTCQSVINVCCMRERRKRQCETGLMVAQQYNHQHRSCDTLYNQRQSHVSIVSSVRCYQCQRHFSTRFPNNIEANASELLENMKGCFLVNDSG